MTCFGNDYYYDESEITICEFCGGELDANGLPFDYCDYSPTICDVCGTSPCDESC